MSQIIQAVLGANYGDEGKGRTVDFLVSKASDRPLVVRHNSGAQAGHTVVLPDGKRHVFSHFGSGTLRGCTTLLGPKFVIHPHIFNLEYDELIKKGVQPTAFADARCAVTTPFDVLNNQQREQRRADDRHGSCGVGFGETIERYERDGERALSLLSQVTSSYDDVISVCATARERLLEPIRDDRFEELAHGYWASLQKFKHGVGVVLTEEFIKNEPHVIFEGAQGLLLHQDHANFPHVTRSRTGLEDVANLLGMADIHETIRAWYCTRTYMTRHGAGPMEDEVSRGFLEDIGYDVTDDTNVPNTYQGTLRYGRLNTLRLKHRISEDLLSSMHEKQFFDGEVGIALNHVDRAPSWLVGKIIDALSDDGEDHLLLGQGPSAENTESRFPEWLYA